MNFDTQSSDVFLFELSSQVSLDKCCLPDTTVTHKDEFEFGDILCLVKNRTSDKKRKDNEPEVKFVRMWDR